MTYSPHTAADRRKMMDAVGIQSTEDLFSSIAPEFRAKPLDVPPALSEHDLQRTLGRLAARNMDGQHYPIFIGAGVYFHYIPAAVGALSSRGEFLTSYTPYQPEVSQGTLQAMYEFQSMVCALMGLEASNASVYDGATALTEATTMARNITGRDVIVVPNTVHPQYVSTLRAYGVPLRMVELPVTERRTLVTADLAGLVDEHTAAVVVQSPNAYGAIEDWQALFSVAHAAGALAIAVANPIALGILESPGACGADIAVAEGQPLGVAPSFGGPALGLMATRNRYLRHLPGRIVGRATDRDGRHGYVLTLRAREQDIRRERAASNICTNQSLMALQATIYMSLVGQQGLSEIATVCARRAHYAAAEIGRIPGYVVSTDPFFHEFVVRCPRNASEIVEKLIGHDLVAGLSLGQWSAELADSLLICVTEAHSKDDIDRLVAGLRDVA